MILAALVVALLGQPAPAAERPATPQLVPFPHPLITEVLFAVPGKDGDADGDGVRSATGDEFVELVNPHDKPINLKGYTLTDGKNQPPPDDGRKAKPTPAANPATAPDTPADDSRLRFVFPDLTLKPGEVVVVFNGYTGSGTRPAPTPTKTAPAPAAAGRRLSMDVKSEYIAFGNGGDCVLLAAPDGAGVQCISWGKHPKPPESIAPLVEQAPECKGSVTRLGLTRGLHPHRDTLGALFSPGVFEAKAPVEGDKRGK